MNSKTINQRKEKTMGFWLILLIFAAIFDSSEKDSRKANRKARKRAYWDKEYKRRDAERRYWEDAHWWSEHRS